MKHEEGQFTAFQGWELYYQQWLPEGECKAKVVIVHGLGEHSGRYENVVNYFVPRGYAVYTYDHRGHGRSPETHCAHVNDWEEYREDLRAFVQRVTELSPDKPLFLLGHSMGGLITLEYALHYPDGLQGVIASAPAVGKVEASPVLVMAGKILSKLKPDFTLSNGLDVTGLSRDTAVVEAYQRDPFVHDRISARWSTEFFGAIEWTQANAHQWQRPLLVIHGEADRLVPIEGSKQFFDKVAHPDKAYIAYADGYHETFNDIEKEKALADVVAWLEAHHG